MKASTKYIVTETKIVGASFIQQTGKICAVCSSKKLAEKYCELLENAKKSPFIAYLIDEIDWWEDDE